MIELKDLRKSYKTGDFVQKALDGVSLNLRDNEFVAILGPSGSGKTTLLNVLGGLDHADSGDIVINGTSTKDYKSKDWDTYRNHRIGFVFQSYNLIPHQTILSNVELALTLSGASRAERTRRAKEALEAVGLEQHVNKKPAQLSGGQMQRVAIARALVNDPEIVLADEPTGALDTKTGVQIMNILKQVASDRLVVMVTHNPELAQEYATRIVNLADGKITGDSDPYDPAAGIGVDKKAAAFIAPPVDAKQGAKKASMSFLTALGLSFNNLMTKKGRTFLTAFAGSIGIIGIAAILALASGVNNYIADTEEDALTSYPLTITKSSFDMTSLLTATMGYTGGDGSGDDSSSADPDAIPQTNIMSDMFAEVKNNDLKSFKQYLDSGDSGIEPYVNTIQYNYAVTPQVFMADTDANGVKQLNPSSFASLFQNSISTSSLSATGGSGMSMFSEMLDDQNILDQQMDVVAGHWPENYDEAVLVLNDQGGLSDYALYSLGVYDPDAMTDMAEQAMNGDTVTVPDTSGDFTIDDALKLHFKVIPAADEYQYSASSGTWTDMSKDTDYMKQQVDKGIDLKIVGVVKKSDTATTSALQEGVAYSPELTRQLMAQAADTDIVKQQLADPDVDVFTGKTFEELQDEQGNNFDMASMFSVDQDKLKEAFSFDSSALENAGSGMSFDPSAFDMGSIDMSKMDTSGMDMSSVTSIFNEDTMKKVMQNAPTFRFGGQAAGGQAAGGETSDSSGEGSQAESSALTEEQQKEISDAASQLAAGYAVWATEHSDEVTQKITAAGTDREALQKAYQELIAEYMQTDEAQKIVAPLQKSLTKSMQDQINSAMQDYMTNQFAPYLASAMQSMMQQAAQAMAIGMAQQMQTQMAAATGQIGSQLSSAISGQLQSQMSNLSSAMQNGFTFDPQKFADAITVNMSQEDLTSLLTNYMNAGDLSYDSNMKKLGYAEEDNPESISIYPIDFPAKQSVIDIIDAYNDQQSAAGNDAGTIQYSDIAGTLMSSVTSIVNTISLVLIAFVGISLVVSSIMIAIITYISVLERKKEIGILRAMGASKFNIANVFNAETIIEGLISGIFAIAVVYLASVPVNAFVLQGWHVPNVMALPPQDALALIAISVGLTFIAGLIPSSMASRRDPVEALRSE
ncbi:ABC transporter ATP-binding protein/permease [Hugonella massiliensis]|uniref:ABC transporter ATP-binding protein/permease n=1 Tax=Hugonella massiliensis TaxID=1720315 RepID=UPI00073F9D7D|nr:ABC transporter ATP-binding protein/permease [Hugonella massiliensis]